MTRRQVLGEALALAGYIALAPVLLVLWIGCQLTAGWVDADAERGWDW